MFLSGSYVHGVVPPDIRRYSVWVLPAKKTKIGVSFKGRLHPVLFAGSENSNSHSAAFGQRHDVGSNADAFPSASPHTNTQVRWRCKYGVSAWMTGVAVVLVVLAVWGGVYSVWGWKAIILKLNLLLRDLSKIYSFQLRLKGGDQKVIFSVFCSWKKHQKKKKEESTKIIQLEGAAVLDWL